MNDKSSLLARLYVAKEILIKGPGAFQSTLFALGSTTAGNNSQSQMLKAYSYMPWLRAAFGKIGDGIGSASWYLEAATIKGKHVKRKSWANASGAAKVKMRQHVSKSARITQIYDHPVIEQLASPNPMMTGESMLALTALHQDLTGEALWWLEGAPNKIENIWPVPPSWITKRPTDEKPYFELTAEGIPKVLKLEEVCWFRNPDPADPYLKTVGTAGPLADELESDEYASKHIKAFFLNRARPDILISGTGLQKEEAERAEERWMSKLGGFWKAHRPHFIGAEVKVTELSGKFTDMQLIDLRKWQRDVVLQAVGLPPEILGVLESSNRATIDTAAFIFARWVLQPRLEQLRAVMQTQLLPHYDDRLVINFFSPVEEDRAFKLEVYKASPWAHTVSDWRELANDQPFASEEDGDYLMVPAAYVPTRSDDLENYESPYTANQGGRPSKEDSDGEAK